MKLPPSKLTDLVEAPAKPTRRRGSKMAALGPWLGISTDELLEILRKGRASGGSAEPPKF